MKIKLATLTLSVFLVFGFVSPSFAGSGTDGVVTVTWKDIKKSKAKNCYKQKINFTRNIYFADENGFIVDFTLYNNEDEEVAGTSQGFATNNPKTSNSLQFCDPPSSGPYYLNIQWLHIPKSGPLQTGEFDIPYKFKK